MYWSWPDFFDYVFSRQLLYGAWTTLWLSSTAMAAGLFLGLTAGLGRSSSYRLLQAISSLYIWLWRGTPVLVQLIMIYTGLPQFGIRLGVIQSVLIGLSLNEGAYVAEIVRAGISSVGVGQGDAGRAVGLSRIQILRLIVLPQAMRFALPPLGNQYIGLLKTTSIASVISMQELMRRAQELAQVEFRVMEAYAAAAVHYLALTSVLSLLQRRLERHFERPFFRADDPRRR
jgi:polar amino acid transport system permease protein